MSTKRTPVVENPVLDEDGYPTGKFKTFDPLTWPYCVDYKFRDEAHAERHQDNVSWAMKDFSVWSDLLSKSILDTRAAHRNLPLLTELCVEVAKAAPAGPYKFVSHADRAPLARDLLELSLNPYSWDMWSESRAHRGAIYGVHNTLRSADERWSRMKISLFDLVEEGFYGEAEFLLRNSVVSNSAGDPAVAVQMPGWMSETHKDLVEFYSSSTTGYYTPSLLREEELRQAGVDEWGCQTF